MEAWLDVLLLTFQLALFLLGRICDDLSWYDLGVPHEVDTFEGIGVATLTVSAIIKIIRKWDILNIIKILFWKSQLKFSISWALTIVTVILFFHIFGCQKHLPESELSYFYIQFDGCCLNAVQILLTTLNYSLICNTKAHLCELIIYETVLFGEIIYNGILLFILINTLTEKPKDYSIIFISIAIANQVLVMDLIFRAAHQEREKEQEKKKQEQKRYQQQTKKYTNMLTAQSLEGILQSKLQLFSPMKGKSSSPTKKNAALQSLFPNKKYVDQQYQSQGKKSMDVGPQYLSKKSSIIFHQSPTKKFNTKEFLSTQKKKKSNSIQSFSISISNG